MHQYPKTQNLFDRDPDTHKLTHQLKDPALMQVGTWLATEKVDGTNVRVLLRLTPESYTAEVRGRSDAANLPSDLEAAILDTLTAHYGSTHEWLKQLTEESTDVVVCLYGEGYGAGIQKVGGSYRPKENGKAFRLFDVTTTRSVVQIDDDGAEYLHPTSTWWRDWGTVASAAEATGLLTVPVMAYAASLSELVSTVRAGFPSRTAEEDGGSGLEAEGVVARTDPYLYDFRGNRAMFKLKTADLA